jgi:hypothetical protein
MVEVIEKQADWSKVKWQRNTGWMMNDFLIFDEEPGDCTVIITGLTEEEARALKEKYPDAEISYG